MKSIVVFCGSGEGYDSTYRDTAYELGGMLAARGIRIIYGGAKVGIMGAIAEGALDKGGEVIGVIPYFLQTKEIAHEGITQMIRVNTMHERKLKMHELCDAVITLPGGFGTMEEMFEVLTWAQLGLHEKPIGLLNINGYYDGLKVMVNNMVQEGFLNECYSTMLLSSESAEELLEKMAAYQPPEVPKYITKQTT
ncbi:MAG: Rossman fold protein, TIGR00730 family [Bacteroidetes bacterium 46-16]|nr:MAG: Rossman fold protein, TIGR00730 family [Bacteroidetes bacterium 46-16]